MKCISLPILLQIHILYIDSSFNIFIVTFRTLKKKTQTEQKQTTVYLA